MPIPTEGPRTANIMIIGDAPSDLDGRSGRPFCGNAGNTLDQILREAGTSRAECLLTTIAKDPAPGGKLQFFFEDVKCFKPNAYFREYIEDIRKEIEATRPNIIIALGAVAMYYLTGNAGINSFRGYITDCVLVPGVKVITTHHPSTVFHEWKLCWQAVMDVRKAIANSYSPDMVVDKRTLVTNPTPTEFLDYCNYLLHEHKDPISLDIETRSPGPHIDILGIGASENYAMSLNFLNGNVSRFAPEVETDLWAMIARVGQEKEIIMQNGTYDKGVLWYANHIALPKFNRDILLAAHACWPECPRSLGFLASICLNVPPWKHTSKENEDLYNAADAANTYGIWNVLEKEMEKLGEGYRGVHDSEMAQVPVAVYLQLRGIEIDRVKQKEIKEKTLQKITESAENLEKLIGRKVNLNSPPQLQNLLYKEMALPPQYKRRKDTGQNTLTAGTDALVKLNREFPNPILDEIMKWKKASKLMTFVDCRISPENRVHTCYNITGATMAHEKKGVVTDDDEQYKSFGRWSSSESIILPYGSGNLQNIPYDARKMYYAGDGKTFVQADYKQAEAVVVAYYTGNEKMKMLFKASFGLSDEECKERNLDIHKITAADMHGVRVEFATDDSGNFIVMFGREITGDERKIGKTIRHATNYSAGPGVLANKLGVSMARGKQLLNGYAATDPNLGIWQKEIQNELKNGRTLTNLLGRPHRFLDRYGDDLFRSAYSFKPQSTVGDLLNKALVCLYNEYGSQVDIALQLHDAIYIRVDKGQEEFGKQVLRTCMIDRVQPLVCNGEEFYIDVDFKTGDYWGDLE